MCLIAFALDSHERYRFVFGGNRDEFYERPTAPAHFWKEHPHLLAGRDLKAGGTWLGVTTDGRIATVTNVHDPSRYRASAKSRGAIVTDYLQQGMAPQPYVEQLHAQAGEYNGFNVLIGTFGELWHLSNRDGGALTRLVEGVHTLSNASLNTPWPKTQRARSGLQTILDRQEISPGDVFELLQDQTQAAPENLPDTGKPEELERAFSSIFISTPEYGTRSATVVLVGRDGTVQFAERTFNASGEISGEEHFSFELERAEGPRQM